MASSQSNSGQWIKFLRPLLWWGILVLVAFAYVEHKRMMERTAVKFTIAVPGQTSMSGAVAQLDGQPVTSGQRISLGKHTLTVTHPKTEVFSADFFAWYGGRDFGQINLKRSMGWLEVLANRGAQSITITGPEVSMTLYDSGGTNLVVPSDSYTIRAENLHWSETQTATVTANQTATCIFSQRFGAIKLTCNRAGATFELRDSSQQVIGAGDFPRTFTDLPTGGVVLATTHHQHVVNQMIPVKADVTNEIQVVFQYGAATVISTPVGASVNDGDGKFLGVTPLQLAELTPGDLRLSVQMYGYEPASATLKIAEGQTSLFQTNLISQNYTRAMNEARKSLAANNFDLALPAINEALQSRPGDEAATALQQKVNIGSHFQQAANFEAQSNYTAAITEYKAVLVIQPDNDRAKQLLAQSQKNQPEQLERERLERLNRPKQVYDTVSARFTDFNLFDDHEIKTSRPAKEVASAIASALQLAQPSFNISDNDSPQPDTYKIVGLADVTSVAPKGLRRCIIVCGQTTDSETRILYKVMEYKGEAAIKFSLGNLLNMPVSENYTPIVPTRIPDMTDKLKAQVQEGVSNVTAIIQGAIGQK